jgi:hypothetical protein
LTLDELAFHLDSTDILRALANRHASGVRCKGMVYIESCIVYFGVDYRHFYRIAIAVRFNIPFNVQPLGITRSL